MHLHLDYIIITIVIVIIIIFWLDVRKQKSQRGQSNTGTGCSEGNSILEDNQNLTGQGLEQPALTEPALNWQLDQITQHY